MAQEETSRAFNRDVFLLLALGAFAIGLFALTRNLAALEKRMELRIAEMWYTKGEGQMGSGSVANAVGSFRKAVANDRNNRKYAFALADALGAANHDVEAEQIVLRLRELDPEDAQINLVLARLASKQGDLPQAVHFYENAIYGRWTGTQVDERRRNVRTQLIRFLLAHHERDRALSELLILDGDLPPEASAHVQAGELFLGAGDAQHALKNFQEAAKLSPRNPSALRGAGEAYFRVGNYVKARRYLELSVALEPKSISAQQLLSLTTAILSTDPLAPKLNTQERQKRLVLGYEQALRRLQNCLERHSNDSNTPTLRNILNEANAMKPNLSVQKIRRDPELLRSGLSLIYHMEKECNDACGEATGADEALLMIASRYDGNQ